MDTYGALTIHVTAPTNPEVEATGDPALDVWAAYLKAYVNANGTAAWAKVFPRSIGAEQIPPILTTWTHQPIDDTVAPFNERYLPALFLYRSGGAEQKWEWYDGRIARDTITLLWVFPTGAQAAERIRVPYVNALVKMIDAAIEKIRDPSYVHTGDPDTTAATLAADDDAIKTAIATSTLPQSYSGAALDGAIGGTAFAQPRAFTVACDAPSSAYVDGSTVSVTGLDVLGQTVTRTITLATASIPGTFSSDYAFTQITQIDPQAQASTAGMFRFGLGAYAGRGSVVLRFAPLGMRRAGAWKTQPIAIPVQMGDKSVPRYYDAVEIPLEAFEIWTQDVGDPLEGTEAIIDGGPGAYQQQATFVPP